MSMKKLVSILVVASLVLGFSIILLPKTTFSLPPPSPNEEVWVDDDYDASTPGWGDDHFATIQDGINAVADGGTVHVAEGTYDEQIIINKKLTIQGTGDTTIIKPSQTTANGFTLFSRKAGGSDNTAAIVVVNDDAMIENLKIDGSEVTSVPSGATFVGILYRGVNGTIDSVTVDNIKVSSGIGGNAIYISSMSNEVNVEVKGCTISNFYKNGITANYEGLTVNIHDNNVIGSGPIANVAQNGIQVGDDAEGTVKNNIVNGNGEYYTGSDWTATGILIHAANATVEGNTVINAQTGIDATGDYWGRFSGLWTVSIKDNTVDASNLNASQWAIGIAVATYSDGELINANIENNQIIGGVADDAGIDIGIAYYGCPGDVIFTVKNNSISDLDYGMYIEGSVGVGSSITNNVIQNNGCGIYLCNDTDAENVVVHYNNIEGNSDHGINNDGTGILDAENNWWGANDGPSGVGPGSGDAVSGNVDYTPWLRKVESTTTQYGDVLVYITPGGSPAEWRIMIPSKGYDTGCMSFNRFRSSRGYMSGYYADKRYKFIFNYYSSGRYHVIFYDRREGISLKLAGRG